MALTFYTKIKFFFLLLIFLLADAEFSLSQSELKTASFSLCVPEKNFLSQSFKGTKPNIIQDSTNSLLPFFEKLASLRNPADTAKTIVRIVHIGDSHVRSHEITSALNLQLIENFGNAATGFIEGYKSNGILEESGATGVICHCIGINGATSQNFLDTAYLAKIQQLKPDLIIISLGTNEGIGRYDASWHYQMMTNLYFALKNFCSNTPILYTTPPGAFKTIYKRYRRHRHYYTKVIKIEENTNIEKSAATIVRFAADHKAACWDLYNIAGGNYFACKNWLNGDFYRQDKIHFTRDGYALQGNLLSEALIKAYNNAVCNAGN